MPISRSATTPSSSLNSTRFSPIPPNSCALINSLVFRTYILATCDALAQTTDTQQDKLDIARLDRRDRILYKIQAKMNLVQSSSKIVVDLLQYSEPGSYNIPDPDQDASEIPPVLEEMCLDELFKRPTLLLNISLAV